MRSAAAAARDRRRRADVRPLFALPIVGDMRSPTQVTGHFWLSRSGTSTLYGGGHEAETAPR